MRRNLHARDCRTRDRGPNPPQPGNPASIRGQHPRHAANPHCRQGDSLPGHEGTRHRQGGAGPAPRLASAASRSRAGRAAPVSPRPDGGCPGRYRAASGSHRQRRHLDDGVVEKPVGRGLRQRSDHLGQRRVALPVRAPSRLPARSHQSAIAPAGWRTLGSAGNPGIPCAWRTPSWTASATACAASSATRSTLASTSPVPSAKSASPSRLV